MRTRTRTGKNPRANRLVNGNDRSESIVLQAISAMQCEPCGKGAAQWGWVLLLVEGQKVGHALPAGPRETTERSAAAVWLDLVVLQNVRKKAASPYMFE